MNIKSTAFVLASIASLCSFSHGATTVQFYIDKLNTSAGVDNPASGAAWALIYDENNDGNLPGGLTDGTSLVTSGATAIASTFGPSVLISNNTVLANGDRIIMTGTVPSNGVIDDVVTFYYAGDTIPEGGSNPVVPGRKFALYWFPGLSNGGTFTTTGAFEIGGVFEQNPHLPSFSNYGMLVPPNGESGNFLTLDSASGFAETRLVAAVIPEPSSALAGILLGFGLMRRRRPRSQGPARP